MGVNVVMKAELTTMTLTDTTTNEIVATISALDDSASSRRVVTRFHANFPIPSTIAPGTYEVSVHSGNGADGSTPMCAFIDYENPCLSSLTIVDPVATSWPDDVFTVETTQPGFGRNATLAVQAALAKAEENGGGSVYVGERASRSNTCRGNHWAFSNCTIFDIWRRVATHC